MGRRSLENPFYCKHGRVFEKIHGRDLLELSFENEFCVNKVAEKLGITTIQLKRHISATVGVNTKYLFRDYRALLCKRMIKEGCSLHRISKKLGYCHYSHFSTDTKKAFGVSPVKLQLKLNPKMAKNT